MNLEKIGPDRSKSPEKIREERLSLLLEKARKSPYWDEYLEDGWTIGKLIESLYEEGTLKNSDTPKRMHDEELESRDREIIEEAERNRYEE